jgi:hypothetical protein
MGPRPALANPEGLADRHGAPTRVRRSSPGIRTRLAYCGHRLGLGRDLGPWVSKGRRLESIPPAGSLAMGAGLPPAPALPQAPRGKGCGRNRRCRPRAERAARESELGTGARHRDAVPCRWRAPGDKGKGNRYSYFELMPQEVSSANSGPVGPRWLVELGRNPLQSQ